MREIVLSRVDQKMAPESFVPSYSHSVIPESFKHAHEKPRRVLTAFGDVN